MVNSSKPNQNNKNGLIKIDKVLSAIMKDFNISDAAQINHLQYAWTQISEDKFRDCTKILTKDKNNKVIMAVESPTIAYELNMMKKQIINKLQILSPDIIISDILFDWKNFYKVKSISSKHID